MREGKGNQTLYNLVSLLPLLQDGRVPFIMIYVSGFREL